MLRLPTICLVLLCGCDSAPETSATDPASLRRLASPAAAGDSGQVHLAAGQGAGIIMSWLQKSTGGAHALMAATLDGDSWSQPLEIARGDDWFVNWADFPSVVEISPRVWAAHWLRRTADSPYAYDVMIALSSDAGRTWTEAFSPHDDATQTEHGFVSLYSADGDLGVVWLDGREMGAGEQPDGPMTLWAARFRSDAEPLGATRIDARVCECCQTDVAVQDGQTHLVYRDRSLSEVRDIHIAAGGASGWQAGHAIAEDGWRIDACPVNGPAIAANGNVLAVAWYTGVDDTPQIRLAKSSDRGRSYAAATLQAASNPLGRVDVEVMNDGRVVVSWLEQVGDQSAELRAQAFGAYGKAGEIHTIARVPAAYLTGFPQMVRRRNELVFAWTGGEPDATRIETAVLPASAF